ncbi:MAG: Crp/Fnr family transcriptional regulator [Burkholderiales bacterium]|nr:Crp/Fnr family transcriptional regulator [Burkholderiales bacterium]
MMIRLEPRLNHLLAALPKEEYDSLHPGLELVRLKTGEIIAEPNKRSNYVYFPVDCVISLYYTMESGASAEIAMIGNEGMFSIVNVMGGASMPYLAVVQTMGHAFRLDEGILKQAFDRAETLRRTLLLYTQALLTQMAQGAVCNRHHSLTQQLCLLLLLVHDKTLSNELVLTQETIANMLGVRREGVTEAAGKLRIEGIIDYKRGHISVIDRSSLETLCCECYGVVKKEFQRLLGY